MKSKNRWPSFLLYTGIASVGIQLLTIISIGQMTHFHWLGSHPISDLGVSSEAILYSVGCSLGALCLGLFTLSLRVMPGTSRWFTTVFSIGIMSELITGLVPDQHYTTMFLSAFSSFHWMAAWLLIVSIPVAMWLFAQTEAIAVTTKAVLLKICVAYVVLLIPEALLISTHTLYAMSEATSLLVFDGWIIFVTLSLRTLPSALSTTAPDTVTLSKLLQ